MTGQPTVTLEDATRTWRAAVEEVECCAHVLADHLRDPRIKPPTQSARYPAEQLDVAVAAADAAEVAWNTAAAAWEQAQGAP